MYGIESWAILDKHARRITPAEMRFLGRIMEKTRRDRIRNETIRRNLGVKFLKDFLEMRQLKWSRHARRIKQYLEVKPEVQTPR